MDNEYIDKSGIKHDFSIYQSHEGEELIFTIQRNGDHFLDLIRDENKWLELHEGPTERSKEYGALPDDFFVFKDRTITHKKSIH